MSKLEALLKSYFEDHSSIKQQDVHNIIDSVVRSRQGEVIEAAPEDFAEHCRLIENDPDPSMPLRYAATYDLVEEVIWSLLNGWGIEVI